MKLILIFAFFEISTALSSGPLSVWYGESRIASVSSLNGIWDHNYSVEKMFDEDSRTYWHSEKHSEGVAKTMRVDFYVSNKSDNRHMNLRFEIFCQAKRYQKLRLYHP